MNLPRSLASWKGRRRRGATVVIVLGLLAMTLAVSYAMMRTQVTSLQIQNNLARRDGARHAAQSGMAAALRRIHDADWPGVNTPLTADLGGGVGYTVTFATGDESLQSGDPLYAEYPFRLTITAKGFAIDPNDSNRRAEYQVQSVVQLVRRAFSSEPAAWRNTRNFTLVQWEDAPTDVQFPVRIEGPVRLGGALTLGVGYPVDGSYLSRYLNDLERMRRASLGDHRPFSGPIQMPYERTPGWLRNMLTAELNLTTVDVPRGGTAPFPSPEAPATYRLYPGGKEYVVPEIQKLHGAELTGVSLKPDVRENPLGVFCSSESLRLGERTTVEGTIICRGSEPDISVAGQQVTWQARELPALFDQPENEHVYLPAGLVADDLVVRSGANASVFGALAVWGDLEVVERDAPTTLDVTGRVLTRQFLVRGRTTWKPNATWFLLLWLFFNSQGEPDVTPYLPKWMEKCCGMIVEPKIKFRPSAANEKHRWQDWSQPVYVPAPGDAGLMWDLLRWTESPAA
jgi:hypothetical protein